jgi:hypothetical protein
MIWKDFKQAQLKDYIEATDEQEIVEKSAPAKKTVKRKK